MLHKRKQCNASPSLKQQIIKNYTYRILSKILLLVSFSAIIIFCIIDYSNYGLYFIKYMLLYTSVLVNLSCLVMSIFT